MSKRPITEVELLQRRYAASEALALLSFANDHRLDMELATEAIVERLFDWVNDADGSDARSRFAYLIISQCGLSIGIGDQARDDASILRRHGLDGFIDDLRSKLQASSSEGSAR